MRKLVLNYVAILIAGSVLFVVPLHGWQVAADSERDTSVYHGTLNGNLAIGLTLIHDPDRKLHGNFFYWSDLKDFAIEGEYTGESDILLRQRDAAGTVIGVFVLQFQHNQDPHYLPESSLEGSWRDLDHDKSYAASLGMRHQSMVSESGEVVLDRNAQAFYFAVLKGDKEKAARYAHYPLRIYVLGNKLARNKTEFLRAYTRIFTPDYLACIKKDVPHHMFHKANHAMIGAGLIWFNEKGYAITLNPCDPDY